MLHDLNVHGDADLRHAGLEIGRNVLSPRCVGRVDRGAEAVGIASLCEELFCLLDILRIDLKRSGYAPRGGGRSSHGDSVHALIGNERQIVLVAAISDGLTNKSVVKRSLLGVEADVVVDRRCVCGIGDLVVGRERFKIRTTDLAIVNLASLDRQRQRALVGADTHVNLLNRGCASPVFLEGLELYVTATGP